MNRPFIFYIAHKPSNMILVMARMTNLDEEAEEVVVETAEAAKKTLRQATTPATKFRMATATKAKAKEEYNEEDNFLVNDEEDASEMYSEESHEYSDESAQAEKK